MGELHGIELPLADWATSAWQGLDANNRFVLLIVAIGCLTGVVCTLVVFISGTISSIHRRRIEAELKREMIDRGLSAADITKIIEAATPLEDGCQRWVASWGKPDQDS